MKLLEMLKWFRPWEPKATETKAPRDANPLIASPATNIAGDQTASFAWELFRHGSSGWAFSAIKVIGQRCAGQKVCVARRLPDGPSQRGKSVDVRRKLLPNHPLMKALDDPNPVCVRWSLIFVTIAGLEITGRYYWWLVEDERGLQIWPLPPSWVYPEHTDRRLFDRFRVLPQNGTEFFLDHDEVLMLSYPESSNPYLAASSPILAQGKAVLADEAIQTAQHRAFSNGLHPGLALIVGRHPDAQGQPGQRPILTADQRKQLIVALKQSYQGALSYDEPLILDGLIEDAKRITSSPREMDFAQSGQLVKERLVESLGVNPIVMGHVEGANYASASVADLNFVQNCINPKLELISQTMTKYFRCWYADPALEVFIEPARSNDREQHRADLDQLGKFGAITINELRAAHGLEPLKVGGDELIQPGAGGLGATSPTGFRFTLADRQG